jgi:hypothetical protein
LDFIVVAAGFAAIVPGVANFTVLRLLRAFRPLRTMNKMKGMRMVSTRGPWHTVIDADAR